MYFGNDCHVPCTAEGLENTWHLSLRSSRCAKVWGRQAISCKTLVDPEDGNVYKVQIKHLTSEGQLKKTWTFILLWYLVTTLSDILGAAEDELSNVKTSHDENLFQFIFHGSFQEANVPIQLTVLIIGCFSFLGFHWFSKILTLGRLFYLLGNTSEATSTGRSTTSAVGMECFAVIRYHFGRNQKKEPDH